MSLSRPEVVVHSPPGDPKRRLQGVIPNVIRRNTTVFQDKRKERRSAKRNMSPRRALALPRHPAENSGLRRQVIDLGANSTENPLR